MQNSPVLKRWSWEVVRARAGGFTTKSRILTSRAFVFNRPVPRKEDGTKLRGLDATGVNPAGIG